MSQDLQAPIAMKSVTGIDAFLGVNCNNYGDLLTLRLTSRLKSGPTVVCGKQALQTDISTSASLLWACQRADI